MNTFNIGELLKYGRAEAGKTVGSWATLIIGYFVAAFGTGFLLETFAPLTMVPGAEPSLEQILPAFGVQFLINILGYVFGLAVLAGAAVIVYHGSQHFAFGDFFKKLNPSKFFKTLGASILVGILIMIGFVLLIVPGVIAMIRLKYAIHAIIQDDMGVIESIKHSWAITKGHRWKLFGFNIMQGLIQIPGALALGIGLLWTMPTAYIADMKAYQKLTGGTSAPVPVTEDTMTVEEAEAIIAE